MLSRHFLRAKVLQALYSAKTTGAHRDAVCRKFDFQIDRLNELAVRQIATLTYFITAAKVVIEEGMHKYQPTEEELNPSYRFVDNDFLRRLADNFDYKRYIEEYHIDWSAYIDTFKHLFIVFRDYDVYKNYMAAETTSFDADKKMALAAFKYLMNDETVRELFVYRSLLWEDDFDQIAQYVFMLLRSYNDNFSESSPLYKMNDLVVDSDREAMDFARHLLSYALDDYESDIEIIKQHLKGWEFDRVALMDILLLVMAFTEFMHCETIPERVTIDEYIELSREFSTDRSHLFINGILDKVLIRLRVDGKVVKTGRGLYDPSLGNEDEEQTQE